MRKPMETEIITTPQTDRLALARFLKGDYEHGRHNLYIVWRGKQALYVGFSRDGIWNRWFFRGGQSHMYKAYPRDRSTPVWRGFTPIGRAIADNLPASLRWKIELRYIPYPGDLEQAERELIHDLHPLFNTTHLPLLTEKELRIYRYLTRKDNEPSLWK